MKQTAFRRLLAVVLAAVMTLGLLPMVALAAGETGPALPAGNMWAYVNYTTVWGMSRSPYALKLYKMEGSTGTAVSAMSDGTYLICAPTTTDSTQPRWMHVDSGNNKNLTNQCGAGNSVPGSTVTTTDTAHQFVFTADADGWYTIKSVANTAEDRYLNTCNVGTNTQLPLSTTPTKFAVVKSGAGAGMFTIAAAVTDPDAPPDLSTLTEPLYGAIVDDDLQYVQANFTAALAANAKAASLNAWRNDAAVSQILLATGKNAQTGVTATAGAFTDSKGHTIAASNVDLSFIKVVKAYNGKMGYATVPARPLPEGNRVDAAEVLMGNAPVDMDAGKVQGLWVTVNVPKDAVPGTYTGTVTVSANGVADGKKLTFTYTLNVASSTLPDATDFKDGFDIELWQNPYASAEYYGVTPFSEAHFKILKPIMEKYRDIGGHAVTATIVEEAWNGQTYSANDTHFPSMVKWTKAADGWSFDYTQFDAWVGFCKNTIGIGDKVVCYSVAPWTNAIRYTDTDGSVKTIATSSSADWNAAWTAFLTALRDHLIEKGWTEGIYIGIDERGFSANAFDLIDGIKNAQGERFFRSAGAMDGFVNKHDLAMRVDDLNVGSIAVKNNRSAFASLLTERQAAGKRTTVYTCTEHKPSSFSLSAPGESYWTMLYSYSVGGVGYLRWAYDSWVADPLRDTTHCNFEAGDCFLIFPDEKENKANAAAHSSLRLEKMAQGVRDVNKLMTIRANCPAMETAVDALAATVKPNYDAGGVFLTDAGKTALAADMKTLRQGIATLTAEYEERLATGDTKKLNIRPQNVPLVTLPDQYQGDVYGPILDTSKQYYGQPDMITLDDGSLVTVFPQGHGHGPLVMMKSDSRGENWEKIATPDSWAASLETPTMYRLNMTDGSTKYVMITARPNWDTNAGTGRGGWDASVSDDGIHWSDSSRFCEDVGYTIVAMASLVQLKDEDGNWMDKWMGVFHNYGFENFKSYLTFDAQGRMQWSEPEKYLSQYRALENKYHICEVGMFRSPDGKRIMALARSDYHDNVHASTMFWSDDEGETWSKPVEMQGALAGERHKALYDPLSGRLVITFREIIWDTNGNGVFEGSNDWLAGDWIAWVGTYEDLMERNEGQYRVLLDEDWANNTYSGDTGYSGMAVYPDGTFVVDTYGHWDKEYSQTAGFNVRQDRCWIRRAKFKLSDIDALYAKQRDGAVRTELQELDVPATTLAANAKANSWHAASHDTDGGPAWAFDDQSHWWHSNWGTATAENISGHPSTTTPIWIQTGFGSKQELSAVSYRARTDNARCVINNYELKIANLTDPTAEPTDADFVTVASGTLNNTTAEQVITLSEATEATHVRLVATSVHGGSNAQNNYVTAQRIRFYHEVELEPEAPKSAAAALTALEVGGEAVAVSGGNLGAVTVTGDKVTLDATISPKAKLNVLVNGLPVDKDQPISLTGDVTYLKLRVVAEDTVTTKLYDLALVKSNTASAQLRDLSLGSMDLYPAFDPAVTEYYAVNYGNKSATLSATAAQTGATVAYEAVVDQGGTGTQSVRGTCRFFKSENPPAANGKLYTADGKLYNKVAITVTAPNGVAQETYTIHVELRESSWVSDLGWSQIAGNTPIRDRAWGYNDLALIGANNTKIMSDTPKGLGTRANTVVEYDLSRWGYDVLSGRVGVSYAQKDAATVPELQFRVVLDGQEAMLKSSTKNAAAPEAFTVNVGAANKMALRTTAVGDSTVNADGNWADLKLSTTFPLLENLETKPITALAFRTGERHTIYANEGDPDRTVTLRPTVTPADSPELLLWESSDPTVATVNDGVVQAVAPGTATITVSNANKTISATCAIVVKQKLMGEVTVSGTKADGVAQYGATLTANLNTFAQGAKDHLSIQWYLNDEEIEDATGQDYEVQAGDIGGQLKVVITGTDPYVGESASSAFPVTKADGPAMQATPTHRNVTGEGATDGAITGLFKGRGYEYQRWELDGAVPALTDPWTPVVWPDGTEEEVPSEGQTHGTGEIGNLGVGNYRVRRTETTTHFAGEPSATVTIVVPGGNEVELRVPQNVVGGSVRANRGQIPVGDKVTLWVTVDEGYELQSLTVTDANENDVPVTEGTEAGTYTFTMPATVATVAVEFVPKGYTIRHELTHISCDQGEGSHKVPYGQELTITLTPDAGYDMPRSLTIVETDTGRTFTDYTYLPDATDSAARVLHFAHGVTKDLTVRGTAVAKTYTVVYALGAGLRAPGAPQTATHGAEFTAQVAPAAGYALPDTLAVTAGGEDCQNVVYDPQTGAFTVPGAEVTGNLVVTATGVARGATLQTVTLIGPARVGRTLTVKTVPVNATVSYEWLRVDETGAETQIPGATAASYDITAEDEGARIRVRVQGTDNYSGDLTSDPTSVILPEATDFVYVTGVSLEQQNLALVEGNSARLTAQVTPDDATSPILFWSSSNDAIATVDQSGRVTARSQGFVTITAAPTDRIGDISAVCRVTVAPAPSRPSGGGSGTSTPSGTTQTRPDGATVTTVQNPDGSKTVTVKREGEGEAKTVTAKNGDVTVTVTDAQGKQVAKVELPAQLPALEERFVDVPQGHWADEAIHNAAALDLVNGVGNARYDMVSPMTRGSLATVLYRLSQGESDYNVTFQDVAQGRFYTQGVAWAAEFGVVKGFSETIFAPEETITREQLAVMLYRYATLLGLDATARTDRLWPFADGETTGDWAADGVAWCIEKDILRGKGGNVLDPGSNVTRAEVAVMLDRFIALLQQ